MTIKSLLKDLPTLEQLGVLQRADVLLAHCAGRYFSGQLTENDCRYLLPAKR